MNRSLAIAAFSLVACGASSGPAMHPDAQPAPAPVPASSPASPAPKEPAASVATPAPPPPAMKLGVTPDAELGMEPAGLGLKVGEKAPSAELVDVTGAKVKLAELYAKGPAYVVFYRGGWCPFCNLQIHELQSTKAEFDARGVKLAVISVDVPTEEAKTQAKQGVTFPMLSDSDLVAHKAFHVVHTAGADEQAKLAGFGLDLRAYSGKDHHSFAVPAIFLVDKKGVVRFAHVSEDYKTRPSAAQLLSTFDKLKSKL